MIICLYHGSSFKGINDEQTGNLTKFLSQNINCEITEAYYSKVVCDKLQRRSGIDMYFESIIKTTYHTREKIFILVSNLIDGEEYRHVLKTVKNLDVANKIKLSKPLITSDSVASVAKTISSDIPTLYVAHGSNINQNEYQLLGEKLKLNNCFLFTLKDDLPTFLRENKLPHSFNLMPFMITYGYHGKIDIEQVIYNQLLELGYNPQLVSQALWENSGIRNLMLNNLKNLISNQV